MEDIFNKLAEITRPEPVDLFEFYDDLPENVQKLLNTFNEDSDMYFECERLLGELKPLGYTFEYGLDGCPYNLTKITLKN